jgi:hypothetical protein
MGFAQHVQEYCEQLGYLAEDNHWVALSEMLRQADSRWLKGGLSKASGTIERIMNERETKIGRRNQILFVLGRLEKTNSTSMRLNRFYEGNSPIQQQKSN